MYPLNVKLPAPAVGFAVANDEAEHDRLAEAGYEPKPGKREKKEDLTERTADSVKSDTPAKIPHTDPQQARPTPMADDENKELELVKAELDGKGIRYDKRIKDVAKLRALLPA